ncbi:hypothetical protein VaNZ11_003654, partial [Volvox africanus]
GMITTRRCIEICYHRQALWTFKPEGKMAHRPVTRSARENIIQITQPKFTTAKCCSRRSVIVHSRQRNFGTESLEHAIQLINKFIFEHEQRRQGRRSRPGEAKGGTEVEVQPVSKPMTFRASAKTEKLVKEPPGPSSFSRSLAAYLALPLDQYSLLDPGWISRSPAAPDVFVLRIPLFDLVGLELQPQITVRVFADLRNGQVHFYADQFKVGDPRFDADFKLAMKATLRNKPVPTIRPLRSIKRMWARAGGAGGQSGGAAGSGSGRGSQAAASAARRGSGDERVSPDPSDDSSEESGGAQVVDAGSSFQGGGASGVSSTLVGIADRINSGPSARGRSDSHAASNGAYEPSGVLDIGLEVSALATSGARPTPVVQPHVNVTREDDEGTAAGIDPPSAAALSAPAASHHAGLGKCQDGTVIEDNTSGTSTSSKSSSSSSGRRSLIWHRTAVSLFDKGFGGGSTYTSTNISTRSLGSASGVAGVETGAVVGGGDEDSGTRGWPAASYGAAHPATTAAPAARAACSGSAMSSTSLTAVQTAAGTTSAPSHPSAAAARPPPSAAGPALRQPVEAAVVAKVAPPPVLAAAAPLAPTSPPNSSSLPFIEDSMLYVPASQWGRMPSGQAGSGASQTGSTITVAAPSSVMASMAKANGTTLQNSSAGGTDEPEFSACLSTAASGIGFIEAGVGRAGRVVSGNTSASGAIDTRSTRATSATPGAAGTTGVVNEAQAWQGGSSTVSAVAATAGVAVIDSTDRNATSSMRPLAFAVAPASVTDTVPHTPSGGGSNPCMGAAGSGPSTQPPWAAAAHDPSGPAGQAVAEKSDSDGSGSRRSSSPGSFTADPRTLTPTLTTNQQDSNSAARLAIASGGGGAAASGADEGATALLVGSVDVAVTVMLPPALSAVPRPLLGMAGSIIARYAISSLLPSFLDLLVADYGRWSSGQTVAARAAPVGNLAAVAAANAAAMGAAAHGARAPQGQQQQQ